MLLPPLLQDHCLTYISGNQGGEANCGSRIVGVRTMHACRPPPLSGGSPLRPPPTEEIELLQCGVGLERLGQCLRPFVSNYIP